ncbi:[histone H3]-trimethyl-L-lysine9/36 demethylase, partial [Lecanoromycetidae sp. Uapishka_2]
MATAAMSPPAEAGEVKMEPEQENTHPALTPPTSENTDKKDDDSDSELSELEPEIEEPSVASKEEPSVEKVVEEIVPDHYYEGGKIPIFKPTMDQFRSFPEFIKKIDKYGMKSGIVKVIPPAEWRDSLPALDEQVQTIKVKNPITQEFHGTHGTYTQANIEKQRSYNLPQWKDLTEESSHQPPAKRGERRRNQEKNTKASSTRVTGGAKRKGPGRPRVRPLPATIHKPHEDCEEDTEDSGQATPLTPVSPALKPTKAKKEQGGNDEAPKPKGRQPKSDQAKSVSSRRQHNKQDQVGVVDKEAFKDFDYRVHNQEEWTTERIQDLETAYWKSLNFSNPMYGADMPGSLFDDSTKEWNVAKLENLLDVLGQNVPGVNTAYLYLGMWKASFAWHLEDVDLYSINYIHFGAPKQWYSISQADARRFEAAMRNVWPNDAKNCDQFLRHKTYLISPSLLQSQYNIHVNRLVHHEGEFVITFPYGYHSGYNLGYNCAESVNFATESWLDYGRVARKCNCEADSVWVDVREIERKLRGEPTPEYYYETDDDEDEDEDEESHLPTPPASDKGKPKRSHKRKRDPNEKDTKPKVKKLRIKLKAPAYEPCILCPSDNKYEKLLPTDNGKQAHERCALYTPETCVSHEDGEDKVCDIDLIDKARLELKCNYCRNKKGSVFQCSQKKCTRAYHATCAAPAGVLVDVGLTPIYGEDGTEYTHTGIDFRCRIHRGRRGKHVDGAVLEETPLIKKTASKIPVGEVAQFQYLQGDIFAGVILENRKSEQTLLIDVLPKGGKVEVEYKWLLVFDPINSQLPVPSENAKPLPPELARKSRTTAEDPSINEGPKPKDIFCDSASFRWEEFDTRKAFRNPAQVKIDLSKPETLWFYLGRNSTEAKAQYTGDLKKQINNPNANFIERVRLETLKNAPPPIQRKPYVNPYYASNQHAINAAHGASYASQQSRPQTSPHSTTSATKERPYTGKYAITDPPRRDHIYPEFQYKPRVTVDAQALRNQQAFQNSASMHSANYAHDGSAHHYPGYRVPQASMAPMAPMMSGYSQTPQPFKGTPEYRVRELERDNHYLAYANVYQRPSSYQMPQPQDRQQSSYQSQSQSQQARPPPQPLSYARPQAPVANMMSPATKVATSTTIQKPPSRPPSAQRRPSELSLAPSSPAASTLTVDLKGVSRLPVSEKYTYLHDAEKSRPQVYQSPYAPGGGFTDAWLPCPTAIVKTRPRGPSISEQFLMKRTPSEQGHVSRMINEDRARAQQKAGDIERLQTHQEAQRQSGQTQDYTHTRSGSLQQQGHASQPQHIPMAAIHQNQPSYQPDSPPHYHNPHSSSTSYQQYNHYSPSYAINALNHQAAPSHQYQSLQQYQQPNHLSYHHYDSSYQSNHQSNQNQSSPAGLQFQSPHEFQMQMQREAQRSPVNSYDSFFKGMQSAANGHQAGASGWGGYSSSSNGQGSPLKYEMSGSQDALPMMRDPSSQRY